MFLPCTPVLLTLRSYLVQTIFVGVGFCLWALVSGASIFLTPCQVLCTGLFHSPLKHLFLPKSFCSWNCLENCSSVDYLLALLWILGRPWQGLTYFSQLQLGSTSGPGHILADMLGLQAPASPGPTQTPAPLFPAPLLIDLAWRPTRSRQNCLNTDHCYTV